MAKEIKKRGAAVPKATLPDRKMAAQEALALSEDDGSTSASDDETGDERDVSRKGLARLMQALGEDGLSEMDRAHLGVVTGEEDEEDDEDEDEDDDEEVDGEEDDEDEDEEEEEDAEEDVTDEELALPSVTKPKSKDSLAASLARSGLIAEQELDEEEEDDDEDASDKEGEEVPLESLSEVALAALPESVRATRMYREKINNRAALQRIREDIALGAESKKGAMPWIETLVVSYDKSIAEVVEGQGANAGEDDLKRELEFYKQALHTATQGRQLAKQSNLPFTRPSDYFAEMVKSDEHMERVRQKLLDERAGLKASEEAKRQRELKKFGKKVQVEKHLERTKSRKELDEKVKGLKRKRKGGLDGDDDDGDDFDIKLESAILGKDSKRGKTDSSLRGRGASRGRGAPKMKRSARDDKFGFGGKKRHAKENTRESTNDTGGTTSRGGRGGARGGRGGRGGRGASRGGARGGASKRPGKARRTGGRS